MTPAGKSVGAGMPRSEQTEPDSSPRSGNQLSRAEMGPVQIHSQEGRGDAPHPDRREAPPPGYPLRSLLTDLSSVQSLSRVRLFATPWTAARQASLSITNSRSLLKLMSIESVMPSNHLILCRPLLLPLSIFLSTGVFSELGTKAPLHLRHILHRVTAEKTLGVWVHGAYKQANVETREQWAGEAGSATPEPMRAPAGSSGPPTKGVTAVRMSPSRPGGKYASLHLTYAARTSLRGKWPHTTRSSTLMEAGLSSVNKRR